MMALLHFSIFLIIAPDIPQSLSPWLAGFMGLGFISIPLGFAIGNGFWRKRLILINQFAFFWMGFFFLTLSFALVEFVISLFVFHTYSYWPLIAAVIACAWSLFHARRPPRIITHLLKGPPVMKSISLVQISDLHIGISFLNEKWLARQVERINELNPDFVAVTGDLADGPFDQVSLALAPLAELKPIHEEHLRGHRD